MSAGLNHQLLRLSGLLHLQQRTRACSAAELAFLMVNDTATVVPCQQAVLWRRDGDGMGRVAALSGTAGTDPAAPYVGWLAQVLPLLDKDEGAAPSPVDVAALPAALARDWSEWLPPHTVWCPLDAGHGMVLGGLLLARSQPWAEGDLQVLSMLAGAYAQSWLLSSRAGAAPPWRDRARRHRRGIAIAAAAVTVLALLPVRQSVLVPAEVVPMAPMLVRAPFEGVVDAIAVAPNAQVAEGQVLVALDTTQLRTRLRVAAKSREIAEAEYGQTAQQALSDPSVKGKLALLQSKIAQQAAEVAFVEEQLRRAEMAAPSAGIAVFDDPNDWIGRPVATGERIMMVADPAQVELEIHVPVADVATFDEGAQTVFFPNVSPDRPADARLVFASHASQPTAEGVLAHRFRARFDGGESLRLGMKGTAKIYGARRPLLLWLLRRPLAQVRQWLML
ncbi:MAG: HlyD family efflux transporter periplasmic adaptor subunit [Magnetospirillum sp.]|nr:HlyD family efflux transporter periplasmic adaptor subunit [Magnetospirillum sp.]